MTYSAAQMPDRAPLAMPQQDLAAMPARQARVATQSRQGTWWRLGVFAPALAVTGLLLWGLHGVFATSGMSALEWLLLTLIGMTFVWVTLAVSTVIVGLSGAGHQTPRGAAGPLDVALLVPIYNEAAWDVIGNAAAMLTDLTQNGGHHRYTLFVLSDSQDQAIAAEEEAAFAALRARHSNVYYRRRRHNVDKKVGNIADWVRGWGAGWPHLIVLDADSLMTGRAVRQLCDEMAGDPGAGLIQSFPRLIGAETVFARVQQFANLAYGWLLAEGLARWSGAEGNYWGHNAIIRTKAFAEAAGLPHLRGGGLILSHDFVEASLLRRAGWEVRFVPGVTGSFEETPGTLIDYAIRDRRWCRGNLQHLRLLGTKGLHGVSRFHLFQGAAAYLMSPAWLMLLVFWTLLGVDAETNVVAYFSEANPLFPNWPPEMTHLDSAVFLVIMYAMLLVPKLTSAAAIALRPGALRRFGGARVFPVAVAQEIVLAVAYAPILMIQQSRAVLRALLFRSGGWTPQQRRVQAYPWGTLMAFHWLETLLGAMLVMGIFAGLVSWWLAPIAVSLALAVPLSALSALNLAQRAPKGLRLESPLTLREPGIARMARAAKAELKASVLPAE
ncbi:MAG: glucans biosynthesis glucosyltransferase MdoH [Pseudomonadota bacterium]